MHNNLPPVLPAGDEPAVQAAMVHYEDNGFLSMIREETTILKILAGVKSVSQSLGKFLVVTCEGRAHQPGAWSPDRSWDCLLYTSPSPRD